MNPEVLPAVEQRLLALGALDVYRTPIVMKKGRLGTCLSVLTSEALKSDIVSCLLTWTTALGVRSYAVEKLEMERDFVQVPLKGLLQGETIQVKRGLLNGEIVKIKPEWEELNEISQRKGIPHAEVLRLVMQQVEE